ncbi:MAG TPA: hypothetical protein VF133_06730 [Terriglobales bacterium]
MDWNEFNSTAVRREDSETIELDLRPFGERQVEALDFWLAAAATQGDPFGKTSVLKTDAWITVSPDARTQIAKLQEKRVTILVVGER